MSAEDLNAEEAVDFEAEAPEGDAPAVSVEEGAGPLGEAVNNEGLKAKSEPAGNGAPATGAAAAGASDDPDDPLNQPPHGTEVFVGGIPRTATEAEVKEFAEQVGQVHSVKLAKDPNNPNQNRGFGFVRYTAKECADAAKEKLHEMEMSNTKIRVSSSQSKHKIYIGNLPRAWTKEKLTDELNKNVKGLESMDLVMSKEVEGQNRGFAFLTFYNHECAAAAKDILTKPSFNMERRQLTVSYAEPKNTEVQVQQQEQLLRQPSTQASKAVYVGNLPPGVTDQKLKEVFTAWGEVSKVVIPAATEKRPEQKFGFIHFVNQSSADKAVTDAAGGRKPRLGGTTLEVKAARPQTPLEQRQDGYNGGFPDGGHGFGGRGPAGRGPFRGGRAPGRGPPGAFPPRGRGRGGRGTPYGGRSGYGYDQGPAFDQGYAGFGQGYGSGYDQGGAYGAYSSAVPAAAAVAAPSASGMTMVPMMLPSGQVGYVLQSAAGVADYSSYGAGGPDRSYGAAPDAYGGHGRVPSRYRPY